MGSEMCIRDRVVVLVEDVTDGEVVGRSAHQGPDVDGATYLDQPGARVGDLVRAVVRKSDGVDLVATPL